MNKLPGGQPGNRGNRTAHPRKWKSTDFASPKLPRHLMPDIYAIAIAMDHDPTLAEKIRELLSTNPTKPE